MLCFKGRFTTLCCNLDWSLAIKRPLETGHSSPESVATRHTWSTIGLAPIWGMSKEGDLLNFNKIIVNKKENDLNEQRNAPLLGQQGDKHYLAQMMGKC